MSAWIFQKPEDLQKLGEGGAPHYVGWYEPDGRRRKKSCGPGYHGKKNAERLKRKLEAQLSEGTYQSAAQTKKRWADFRREYEAKVLSGLAVRTQGSARSSLGHFERIIKPVRIVVVTTQASDNFIAARRQEPGQKKGELLSPASINHALRHLKAALRIAGEWGYLKALPKFRMERAPKKLPTYVTGDHFAAIYHACGRA